MADLETIPYGPRKPTDIHHPANAVTAASSAGKASAVLGELSGRRKHRLQKTDAASALSAMLGVLWTTALLFHHGRLARAEALFRRVVATRVDVLGPDDPHTLEARAGLASVLNAAGRGAEALDQMGGGGRLRPDPPVPTIPPPSTTARASPRPPQPRPARRGRARVPGGGRRVRADLRSGSPAHRGGRQNLRLVRTARGR